MELVGEEKRIQALFSELRAEDESLTQRFATVWNRAEAQASAVRAPFRLSLVYATAFFVLIAISSVAVWQGFWRKSQPGDQAKNNEMAPTPFLKQERTEPAGTQTGDEPPRITRRVHQSLPARRQVALSSANKKAASEAAAISNWQSPTMVLLLSPGEEIFTSLPQLDENASELKSFLGKTPK